MFSKFLKFSHLSRRWLRRGKPAIFTVVFSLLAFHAPAAIRFDLFFGYDGIVPEACWFPLVCEISNDGPPFIGVVELAPGNYNQGQTRRTVVELPTGTLNVI